LRAPTQAETALRFKIPIVNLSRWKREEAESKYKNQTSKQCRAGGGGRRRKYEKLERDYYERFRYRRASGAVVRRGWFRGISKQLYIEHYPDAQHTPFLFSNGWFRSFLSWHQISLRFVTNTASKLPTDFGEAILAWMRFSRRNSQLRPQVTLRLGDQRASIGRYRLCNIANMDQTPLPFEYLDGRTYN